MNGKNQLKTIGLRTRQGSPLITYVAIKRHEAKHNISVQDNAVFVAGLPLGFDEAVTKQVFSCFGEVCQVVMHHSKRSAIVVFTEAEGAQTALGHAGKGQIIEFPVPEPEGPIGLKSWVEAHRAARPGNAALQKQLDDWMEEFEAAEERKRREREAAMAEDGWTVVVRTKGRKKAAEADGVSTVSGGVAAAAAAAVAADRSKSAVRYEDFYRFQQRDKRRSELMDLKRNFEADRKRLSELRAARRFNPY